VKILQNKNPDFVINGTEAMEKKALPENPERLNNEIRLVVY